MLCKINAKLPLAI